VFSQINLSTGYNTVNAAIRIRAAGTAAQNIFITFHLMMLKTDGKVLDKLLK